MTIKTFCEVWIKRIKYLEEKINDLKLTSKSEPQTALRSSDIKEEKKDKKEEEDAFSKFDKEWFESGKIDKVIDFVAKNDSKYQEALKNLNETNKKDKIDNENKTTNISKIKLLIHHLIVL